MNSTPEVLDRRLYAELLRRLHSFQDGGETLHSLIENLKTLAGQLQAVVEPWRNEFDGLVSELEYAHNQSDESGLSSQNFGRVTAAVQDIELMVFAARTWTEQEKETIRKIVEVHRPELLSDFDLGMQSGFAANQVEDIRDSVRDELEENGFTNGEINEWGKICEDFVERIRPLTAQK